MNTLFPGPIPRILDFRFREIIKVHILRKIIDGERKTLNIKLKRHYQKFPEKLKERKRKITEKVVSLMILLPHYLKIDPVFFGLERMSMV